MRPPHSDECHSFYETYVARVPATELITTLAAAPDALESLLQPVAEADEFFAYTAGKWSFRQLLGHVIDTERLFSYRALHFARGDSAELPGMEQEAWVAGSNAEQRSVADQLAEFRALRTANTAFFAALDEQSLARGGIAGGFEVTVRALVFIAAGHELHHRAVLAERYLPALAAQQEADGG